MPTPETALGGSAVFQALDPAHQDQLAGCARGVSFAAGEQLFREGDLADAFYLVREGRVQLETWAPGRGTLPIEIVGPGELVGWSWLSPPYRWQSGGRAVDTVRATAFDGACVRGKLARDPRLGYELIGRFSEMVLDRLIVARHKLIELHSQSVGG